MRLLLAEDDPGLRSVLVQGLEDAGYIVDAVARGDDAQHQLSLTDYDVAVLDWRMPGLSGLEVARWAKRERRPTAVLLLTAMDTVANRIEGLDAGADDYLVKPFDFGELLARIRALQRRPHSTDPGILARGDITIDPAAHEVRASGTLLSLTPTEYDILELLARRAPSVVDRLTIARHAWSDETEPLGSNAIDVQMSRLRAKLPSANIRITTVRGAGYRLDAG